MSMGSDSLVMSTLAQQKEPAISVVLSTYNGERFLREAIDSILQQTFTDFEFIIINDASTDGTADILATYDDPRMRVLTNDVSLRLTKSLNKGIAQAGGKYVARMDDDDIALPQRLEKQYAYMEAHPEVAFLNTWMDIIRSTGMVSGSKKP